MRRKQCCPTCSGWKCVVSITMSCAVFLVGLNLNLVSRELPGYTNGTAYLIYMKNHRKIDDSQRALARQMALKDFLNSKHRRNEGVYDDRSGSKADHSNNLDPPFEEVLSSRRFYFMHKEWLDEKFRDDKRPREDTGKLTNDVNNDVAQALPKVDKLLFKIASTSVAHQAGKKMVQKHGQNLTVFPQHLNQETLLWKDMYETINGEVNAVLEDTKDTKEADEGTNGGDAAYRKHIYNKYYRKITNQVGVDCPGIVRGDPNSIEVARNFMDKNARKAIPAERYQSISNCENFKRTRGYIDDPLSEAERNFPLAFSLIVFRDVEQIERLLRSIYRPHNFYCIHADTKMLPTDRRMLEAIVSCFDNVFMASTAINVTWGEFSVLETELICMKDLLFRKGWKYFINLTGQEFPLKTNREIVKILEAMEGENVVDGAMIRYSSDFVTVYRLDEHTLLYKIFFYISGFLRYNSQL